MIDDNRKSLSIGAVTGGISATAIYVVTSKWDRDKRLLASVLGGSAIGGMATTAMVLHQEGIDIATLSILGAAASFTGLAVSILKTSQT